MDGRVSHDEDALRVVHAPLERQTAAVVVDVDALLRRRSYPRLVATSRVTYANSVAEAEALLAAIDLETLWCIVIVSSTPEHTVNAANSVTEAAPGVPLLLVDTDWPVEAALRDALNLRGDAVVPGAEALRKLRGFRRATTNRPW